jgi:hypothetical protein
MLPQHALREAAERMHGQLISEPAIHLDELVLLRHWGAARAQQTVPHVRVEKRS